jgi:hypothetical protein
MYARTSTSSRTAEQVREVLRLGSLRGAEWSDQVVGETGHYLNRVTRHPFLMSLLSRTTITFDEDARTRSSAPSFDRRP